jgi:hypothetical protein
MAQPHPPRFYTSRLTSPTLATHLLSLLFSRHDLLGVSEPIAIAAPGEAANRCFEAGRPARDPFTGGSRPRPCSPGQPARGRSRGSGSSPRRPGRNPSRPAEHGFILAAGSEQKDRGVFEQKVGGDQRGNVQVVLGRRACCSGRRSGPRRNPHRCVSRDEARSGTLSVGRRRAAVIGWRCRRDR